MDCNTKFELPKHLEWEWHQFQLYIRIFVRCGMFLNGNRWNISINKSLLWSKNWKLLRLFNPSHERINYEKRICILCLQLVCCISEVNFCFFFNVTIFIISLHKLFHFMHRAISHHHTVYSIQHSKNERNKHKCVCNKENNVK